MEPLFNGYVARCELPTRAKCPPAATIVSDAELHVRTAYDETVVFKRMVKRSGRVILIDTREPSATQHRVRTSEITERHLIDELDRMLGDSFVVSAVVSEWIH